MQTSVVTALTRSVVSRMRLKYPSRKKCKYPSSVSFPSCTKVEAMVSVIGTSMKAARNKRPGSSRYIALLFFIF
ncbi:hypothetical protein D3C85_1770550 [compost metagenome]